MTLSRELRFDEQVVIIINGDSGMGRSLALLYGLRGARVVVNAGANEKSGKTQAVDIVVYEILKHGGNAVPNYDPITSPDKIINCAIDHYGGIDAIVCDFGSTDRVAYSNDNWDETITSRLTNIQRLILVCWPHFQKQRYGRIVLVTNGDGISGAISKAPYAVAKMGVIGLCQSFSKLGSKDNIFCNTYVLGPTVLLTKSNKHSYPDHSPEQFARLSPLIFFLTSEQCSETGSLFELGPRNYLKIDSDQVAQDSAQDFILPCDSPTFSEEPDKPRPLEGLVAFVTGADTGLGLCIADKLKDRGALVVAYKGNHSKKTENSSSKFSLAPVNPSVGFKRIRRSSVLVLQKMKNILMDPKEASTSMRVISSMNPEIALSMAIAEHGKIDILVNCCSFSNDSQLSQLEPEYLDLMFKHHVSSAYALSKEVLSYMSSNKGRIFNIAPISTQLGTDIINMSLRGLSRASATANVGITTIFGQTNLPTTYQQIASLVASLSNDVTTFSGATLEIGEDNFYQVDFKHTMGFRIPDVDSAELPEHILKRWWQISKPVKMEAPVDRRRMSLVPPTFVGKIRRMSLTG